MEGIGILLKKDGVLIIEAAYLLDMINNMVFDYIYHEHLSYFSILPLVNFFKKLDMRLIHIQEVPTKGGSLRYYWTRENSKWSVDPSVKRLSEQEKKANIGTKTFEIFQAKIDSVMEDLIAYLKLQVNKIIVGYGASATSTTLISHFQLNQYLSYLVDDNPAKIGTFSPGYHLPVYGSEKLLDDSPDVIIILAWRFKEEIQRKLTGVESQVIIPLPNFEVLKA